MVTVTFQCDSFVQLQKEMYEFLGRPQFDGGVDPVEPKQLELPVHVEPKSDTKPFDINVDAKPEKKERKPRTKKARNPEDVFETKTHDSKAEEETAENESPAIVQHNAGPAVVNKEAVHQALQQVNINAGLPKAREILQSFGVNRISEIKEEQFKAFIEKCNTAVMMA